MFELPIQRNLIHGYTILHETIDPYWLCSLPGVDKNSITFDQIVQPDDTIEMQFLVMPLYSESLSSLLTKPLKSSQLFKYVLNVANALDFLHKQGNCCHCDVKPANILLNKETDELVLVGLGTCTKIGQPITVSTTNMPHLPPDDMKKVTTALDVYGLGLVLYELLSGQQLFSPLSPNCRWAILKTTPLPLTKYGPRQYTTQDIPFNPLCPEKVQDIIYGTLHPNSKSRMEIGEIIQKLQELINNQ